MSKSSSKAAKKVSDFRLEEEMLKISRICLAVFFVFISFGIFAPTDDLGLYDPKWLRVLHSFVSLGFFVGTFFVPLIRKFIQPIMLVLFYTMSAHSLILLYWNSLYIGYLVGMILVISCIGVSFVDRRLLVSYLSTVSSAGILIGIYTKEPVVDLPLYLSAIITPALVSYLTLNVRLSSVEKLRVSESELKKFHDRISYDLELAKETQSNLIALDWPKIKGIKISSFFKAYDKVGGDAISYVKRDDGSLAVFFADVSGHGIASAMVSAMAILSFKIQVNENQEPASCLKAIHKELQDLVPNNHISACVLYLYPEEKKINYSIAGHPPILHIDKDGVAKFLSGEGTLIVSYLSPVLKNYEAEFTNGERFLLYSDGLIEVFNDKDELFGEIDIFNSILKNQKKRGEDFLGAVYSDALQFSNKPFNDDVSLLLIESI